MKKLIPIITLFLMAEAAFAGICFTHRTKVLRVEVEELRKSTKFPHFDELPNPPNGTWKVTWNGEYWFGQAGNYFTIYVSREYGVGIQFGGSEEVFYGVSNGKCQTNFLNIPERRDPNNAYYGGEMRVTEGVVYGDSTSDECGCFQFGMGVYHSPTDFNRDCVVDMRDVAVICNDWLCNCGEEAVFADPDRFCGFGTDLDQDGVVDINDLVMVMEDYIADRESSEGGVCLRGFNEPQLLAVVSGIEKNSDPRYFDFPEPPSGTYYVEYDFLTDEWYADLGNGFVLYITSNDYYIPSHRSLVVINWFGERAYQGGIEDYCQNTFYNIHDTNGAYYHGKVFLTPGYWLEFPLNIDPNFIYDQWDFNFNKETEFEDFSVFSKSWLKDCGDAGVYNDPNNNCKYGTDLDSSGEINVDDLVEIAENWLIE